MDIERYVEELGRLAMEESVPGSEDMSEAVQHSIGGVWLKGRSVELWRAGDLFWLVADDEDAIRLSEPRGTVYSAAEVERIATIADPEIVADVNWWKREFDGRIRSAERGKP